MPLKFCIARDEGCITVVPDHPDVRKFLTLERRDMVKEKGRTKFVSSKEEAFKPFLSGTGHHALKSLPGFWYSLAENLQQRGHEVSHLDYRPEYPEPRIDLAVKDLYRPQAMWVTTALMRGCSGLLGAPTRYGKSFGMTAICRAFPSQVTVVVAPGADLCRQLYDHFCKVLPHRDIRAVYSGAGAARRDGNQAETGRRKKVAKARLQGPDITICSLDSLHKMDPDITTLLLVDEPHSIATDNRAAALSAFVNARKYGFGATLKGRFDKRDRLIEGLIGPVISNVTYLEAVAQDVISPLKLVMVNIPFSKDTVPGIRMERDQVYSRLLTQSTRTAGVVRKLMHEVIPLNWQTMAFIMNEKQAEFYLDQAMPPEGTIAMAKRMANKEREQVTEAIADGTIKRVLASNIYVQGLTFPDLKVVVNLAGGGANTTAIQKPGRLLQKRPGKRYGVMIDFMFVCRDKDEETRESPPYAGLIGECYSRLGAYREIGYEIVFADTAADVQAVLDGAYENGYN